MKLGLSHQGTNTDLRCLWTGYWGDYLDLRDRK